MKGSKRYRSGAWRLVVAAGRDPVTGRRRNVYDTVVAPDNRVGAKAAHTRLAELIIVANNAGDLDRDVFADVALVGLRGFSATRVKLR